MTEKKCIIIFLVSLIIFSILLSGIGYYNKARSVNMVLDDYTIDETNNYAIITNVSQYKNYLKVEGRYEVKISSYKIDIALEDENGQNYIYKTELQDKDQRTFYTLINMEKVSDDLKINIVYCCDNQKILIKTNRTVGEFLNE